ncbi:hypothetical protein PUMCH_000750 [Australozyma saopauloensis]|uniref:CCHC-type domain-containing protein n=1 Tax=Australozyma saopauloensis TaxID=291208 RepID=A0AAX4H4S7_9ASCO|nr:hypothetical protein PUMCH_000750 [[Candida] saopauloensis]
MSLLQFTEDTAPSTVDNKVQWKNALPKLRLATPEPSNLEKAKKAQKKEDQPQKEGIISLSYDQVNDNADELVELRGEGRYFGVLDPSTGDAIANQKEMGPLCDNCHKRGHMRSKCKTVVCHKCGVVGDHYETQCPTTVLCGRCGEKGHIVSQCTSRTRKRQYCKTCDSLRHSDETCPGIWRSYLTIPGNDGKLELPIMFCYNCASSEHYGDDCPQERGSRIPNLNGSAFSGINLPLYLRDKYFAYLDGRSQRPTQNIDRNQNGQAKSSKDSKNKEKNKTKNKSKDYKSKDTLEKDRKQSKKQKKKEQRKNLANDKSNDSNNNGREFKRLKKNDSNRSSPKPNGGDLVQPSRSGFISLKPQSKRNYSASDVQPNRSGVVSKKQKKNYQQLY